MRTRRIRVVVEADAAEAVRVARELGSVAGLSATDVSHLATAVSEIALNQLRHAGGGTVDLRAGPEGVLVEARDSGPGIPDVPRAMADGFSTAGSLGLGLPGARRLMDEFEVRHAPDGGLVVRMAKWGPATRAAAPARPLALHAAVEGRLRPVVARWPAGLLLALAPAAAAGALRAAPSAPPAVLLERAGGRDLVAASFSELDGRLVWQALTPTAGLLRRARGERAAIVATAPRPRAGTVAVQRGDLLVLASFPVTALPEELPSSAGEAAARVVAMAPPAADSPSVLAAVFVRGTLEAAVR